MCLKSDEKTPLREVHVRDKAANVQPEEQQQPVKTDVDQSSLPLTKYRLFFVSLKALCNTATAKG